MRLAKPLFALLLASVALLAAGDQVALAQGHWQWMPRVAIVWPHDGQGHQTSVDRSRAVNVAVWPENQVNCSSPPTDPLQATVLLMAVNNEPAVPVPVTPQLVLRTVDGVTFPSLEYNNIPADLAAHPGDKYTFVAGTGTYLGPAWVHAADPRTFLPDPVIPTGYSGPDPKELDARIQVVWPHDANGQYAPVERATFVNIAVDLFEHGTNKSVPLDYELAAHRVPGEIGPLLLYAAKENDPMLGSPPSAERVTYTANGQTFPRWVFNNVPVQPGRQYHFAALPAGLNVAYPSIWTHGPDARTYLPTPELPPACPTRVIARPSPAPTESCDPNAPPTPAARLQN